MAPPARPAPPPYEGDTVRVVLVGTALWLLALLGLGVARLAGADVHGWWLVMCAAGAALGVFGVPYSRRRQARLAEPDPPA
jgi:Protein of unknown function (DUF2530)